MKTRNIALFILLLIFASPVELWSNDFVAKAEISGGIVYSNGKDAIYYEFATKESRNLTSDLKEAVIKNPFAVSENGKQLIWLQNYKFYLRELPIGTPRAVQLNKAVWHQRGSGSKVSSSKEDIKEDIIWQGGDIKNMSLSPDGSRFAFDVIFNEPSWFFTGENKYTSISRKGPFPFFARKVDSFNGIFYLSTIRNKFGTPANGPSNMSASMIRDSLPRYGNAIERPPVPFYMASYQDLPIGHQLGILQDAGNPSIRSDAEDQVIKGGELDTGGMIAYQTTIKKNAYYLTFKNLKNWEEDKKLGAFIYQIGNQWGPIELRVLDLKRQGVEGGGGLDEARQSLVFSTPSIMSKGFEKPREWEILLSLRSCEGLFWKPDGSLTIQSGGNLYSIDGSDIEKGINNSSVTKRKGLGNSISFTPVNNVFSAQPKLVAEGINSTCIHWVTDNTFLFLDKGTVYLWNNGKKEKALDSLILSQFYYCSKSPFANITSMSDNSFSGKDTAMEWEDLTYSLNEKLEGVEHYINVGSIKTSWTAGSQKNIAICIKDNENTEEKQVLEFTLLKESDLNNIKDPSQYEYNSQEKQKPLVGSLSPARFNALVGLNKIIILKKGNDYAAIKPIEIGLLDRLSLPPIKSMTYEWKFWRSFPDSKKPVKIKTTNKTTNEWKIAKIPALKEFEIGGVKFNWEPIDIEKKKAEEKAIKERKPFFPASDFTLKIQITDITNNIGWTVVEEGTDLRDLSLFNFRMGKIGGYGWNLGGNEWKLRKWDERKISNLILKIGNEYIAIKPLGMLSGSNLITYKWKFWPENPPAEENLK